MSKMAQTTLCNVNRCVGCWTCAMACKVAYDLPEDEYRMYVETIGAGGVDLPGGTWPDLHMSWKPVYKANCPNCAGDEYTGGVPYCVYNCTTEALTWGNLSDPDSKVSRELAKLKGLGYRVYEPPKWEGTRADVLYAEKGQ